MNILVFFAILALIFVIVGTFAYIYNALIPTIGTIANSIGANTIGITTGINQTWSIADNLLVLGMIMGVFASLLIAYFFPDKVMGFLDFLGSLLVAPIVLLTLQVINPLALGFSLQTTFPQFYALLNNPYLMLLLFFGLIISCILNIRGDIHNNSTSSSGAPNVY